MDTGGVFTKRLEKTIESTHRGIQLLPSSLLASGCTAKLLSFSYSIELTVSEHTLYEKKQIRKGSAEALQRLRTSDLARKTARRFEPVRSPIAHCATLNRARYVVVFLQINIMQSRTYPEETGQN